MCDENGKTGCSVLRAIGALSNKARKDNPEMNQDCINFVRNLADLRLNLQKTVAAKKEAGETATDIVLLVPKNLDLFAARPDKALVG